MRDKEVLRLIDDYLNGRLSEEEIDQLWAVFLEEQKYLQWLEIEVAARDYFHGKESGSESGKESRSENSPGSGRTGEGSRSLPSEYKYWIYGFAAVVVLLFSVRIGTEVYKPDPVFELPAAIPPREMVTRDLYRDGSGENYSQPDVEINRGFEAALSGRTQESGEILEQVLLQDLSPAQFAAASFNYAILLYNRSEYEAASEAFEDAVRAGILSDHALEAGWWYLALSRARLNDDEGAGRAAVRAAEFEGLFHEDAGKLLEWLENENADL